MGDIRDELNRLRVTMFDVLQHIHEKLEPGKLLDDKIARMITQNSALKVQVERYIERLEMEAKNAALREEISVCDDRISEFATQIDSLDDVLYHARTTQGPGKPLFADTRPSPATETFSVHQITLLAERLGIMSHPPDFTERQGLNIYKAPGPREELMCASILRHTPQELLQIARDRKLHSTGPVTGAEATAVAGATDIEELLDDDVDLDDLTEEELARLWSTVA